MADRYWVGGTGSWNSTTKWSATSGGASGASVPTASDNAIFDANSGPGTSYVVTVTDNATCADLTFTPTGVDGATQFSVGTGFVIAGTFSTSSTQGNRRAWFRSSTEGLTRDMQIATIGTVTDVDFRDIRVTGAGGTLTGTRIGDLRGNFGITFSAPKIVYWNLSGAQNWSADAWASASGGAPNTDNFPLAQDTAVFDDAGSVTGVITFNSLIAYTGTVDMSARTSAMTCVNATNFQIYGDWLFGSGVTMSSGSSFFFSGRNTQVITSAGKTFSGGITIDSFGGTVELADALNIGTQTLTVTNGTFDTKGYNVTAATLSSGNNNVRAIKLGASTVTLSGASTSMSLSGSNLDFDAGTSTVVVTAASPSFSGGGNTFYDVSFTNTTATTPLYSIFGSNIFNNLSITAPSSAGIRRVSMGGDQTITGTLTCAGASAVRRIRLESSNYLTPRTLTVGTLSADDCDFEAITIAGGASGASPTRAGDCGGNSGITFPAPKTVYWNLAGGQNWSNTGWATTSGGSPAVNNFPLAQDTAVFDNTGAAGSITVNAGWSLGTVDASTRTSAMTITFGGNAPLIFGDLLFGTGITHTSSNGSISFRAKGATQTLTTSGVTFGTNINVQASAKVSLGSALTSSSSKILNIANSSEFYANTYNVTYASVSYSGYVLDMGSGTWTITGTGNIWNMSFGSASKFFSGTSEIVLSSTSTATRTFNGGGAYYNKLTIGGATGSSQVTFLSQNTFGEIASTKTVAHTLNFGTTAQTFCKWSVTGTSGNAVNLGGTTTSLFLLGEATSGIDYINMQSIRFSIASAEFYAGANSTATGTPAAPNYLAATPAARTLYWVGGSGNWKDTTNWSLSSGGAGGEDPPRSIDDVVFDSSSNATAYSVNLSGTGVARGKDITIGGPASGNVTFTGSSDIYYTGDVTIAATGVVFSTTGGSFALTATTAGRTITTNGVYLSNTGVGMVGVLGSCTLNGAITTLGNFFVSGGSFDTAGYTITSSNAFNASGFRKRSLTLGASNLTAGSMALYTTTGSTAALSSSALTLNAGTSSVTITGSSPALVAQDVTFYDLSLTSNIAGTHTMALLGCAVNDLSITGPSVAGVRIVEFDDSMTINGTLTLSAGANAAARVFVRSDVLGTARVLTCNAVGSLTDIDFRDITIAGAAVSGGDLTGTRLGDCKGNTGITFGAGANKYWNLAVGGSWDATAWATSSGGAVSVDNFPLAQDTCIFEATGLNSGTTISVLSNYNIGTIDMSARTSNTVTLSCTLFPNIYGNWINGTGTSISGTGGLFFNGRGSQTITSAGKVFTQAFTIDTPGGSVTLQDAFITNRSATALTLTRGTFDANGYNVSLAGSNGTFSSSNSNVRTLAVGSGTWTISGATTSAWSVSFTNITVTGTGTISFVSATSKSFSGGSVDYSGITVNQGGSGILTFSGNNTLADITNSYSATGATTINFGTTTQRVGDFTATGEAGNVLTIQGSSATSPCTLIHTGTGDINVDYLNITGVRAYPL